MVFNQQKQICVTSIPDLGVSRCENKFQGNGCITSPEKKDQTYFTMPSHSKREIRSYKSVDTGIRPSLFHSHCSAPPQYQAIQKQQTAELGNTKNFESMAVLTEEEARKELKCWVENLHLTKGKTLINAK